MLKRGVLGNIYKQRGGRYYFSMNDNYKKGDKVKITIEPVEEKPPTVKFPDLEPEEREG